MYCSKSRLSSKTWKYSVKYKYILEKDTRYMDKIMLKIVNCHIFIEHSYKTQLHREIAQ